jgi:hypothetical protein
MKRTLLLLLAGMALGPARADIIFRAEPPPAPDKVPLVQVSRWPMSYATFQRRAAEFGMQGRPVKAPRGLVLQSGPLLFQQDPMGTQFFANTDLFMAEPPGEVKPLPEDDVIRRAKDFIDRHPGGVNLKELDVERVSHLFNTGQVLDTGQVMPPTQDESIVIFRRLIEGIPVISPGGTGEHLRVHIANTGEIVGQQQLWRNARASGEFLPTRPFDLAKREFVDRLTKEMGQSPGVDALITEIQFGLFSRPEGQSQGYLLPAYLFKVQFFDKEMQQTTGARFVPIPAVDPALLPEPLEMPLPPPEEGRRENIVFKAEPPPLPAALPAVQIQPIKLTPDLVARRGVQLGIANGTIAETPRGFAFSDKRLLLFQDPFGTELFSDTERMMAEKPGEAPPISDREAIAIAQEYVKGLGDVDPGELGAPMVRHLFQQMADTKGGRPADPTQDETIVEFPRQLAIVGAAPIPFIGPGAFLNVHVDNFGKATGHRRAWRPLGQTGELMKLRDLPVVQEEFVRQLLSELGTSIGEVTSIQAGLYMRGEGMPQGFAQPALLYDVDIRDPDTGEVTAHRQIPIPAAGDIMEPLDDPDAQVGLDTPDLQNARGADQIPLLFGDMTNDGKLALDDVVLAIQYAGGLADLDNIAQLYAGDVAPASAAGDGSIQLNDALRILRGVFGLEDLDA